MFRQLSAICRVEGDPRPGDLVGGRAVAEGSNNIIWGASGTDGGKES